MQEGAAQLFSQKLQCIADELAEASAEKVRQRIQDEAVAATEMFEQRIEQTPVSDGR